jgi:hypothetical protein
MDSTTICLNGELKPGDLVLSAPDEDYACLVGTVLAINKVGTPEHDAETENTTDAIHVDFMNSDYSEERIREIEEMFSDLYGMPKKLEECPIDDTIMSPDSLIRITGTRGDLLRSILSSHDAAEALYRLVELGPGFIRDPAQTEFMEEKLYSPLKFYLRDKEDAKSGVYDEMEYWRDELSHEDAFEYIHHLEAFLAHDRKDYDTGRGLAEYIDLGPLGDKVRSLVPHIELHGDKLWVVAHLSLTESLSPPELLELKDWWTGQLSDGVGESWEQREIKVERGELYLEPWTSDDRFFIDTQREFSERLGLETPTQAALHEPDIFDDDATDALRKQLIERLDKNLLSYFDELHTNQALSINEMSSEIAAVAGAHYYMSEIHNFHTSELEYLLQFQNPLQVVGDAFQFSGMEDYSDVMWKILDRQDALQGDYALMPESADEDTLRQMFFEKLDANWEENMDAYRSAVAVPGLSMEELLSLARNIESVNAAHTFLKLGYEFREGELARLDKLAHPLDVVADGWRDIAGYMDPEEGMRDFLSGMDNVCDEPLIPPTGTKTVQAMPAAEKRSVLEQLREAGQVPKEPHKDKPSRDKSGSER